MGAWDEFDKPVNEGPNYWNPEEPEKITGKVLDIDVYEDEEGKRFPQLVLEVDGEELTVTAFRSILRNELLEAEPKVGDTLEIDFQGKAPRKRYFVYRVKVLTDAPKRAAKGAGNEEF